jgi:hypothetical protein
MHFADRGYQVFTGLISDAALVLLRDAAAELCRRFRTADLELVQGNYSIDQLTQISPHKNPGYELNSRPNEPFIIGELCRHDERFICGLTEEALWNAAAGVLAVQPEQLVYHFSNLTRKPAGIGPQVSWHRDYPNGYIRTKEPHFLRLLIALQPICRKSGGLGFMPYSHLVSDETARNEKAGEPSGMEPEYPELQAGDVLAIHPKAVHGSPPNRGSEDRDAIILQIGIKDAEVMHREEEYLSFHSREAMLSKRVSLVEY